jgi:hypothetical protein
LSRWIDPRTAAKLIIVPSAEVLSTLSKTIDTANMPQNFGGELKCNHGMIPSLDEGLLKTANWLALCDNQLPPGPLKWTIGTGGHEVLIAVGKTDKETRQLMVGQLNRDVV